MIFFKDFICHWFTDTEGENMTELMVSEGLVELRRGGLRTNE